MCKQINRQPVIFVFYNDTHAFYVDYKEFVEKNMKFDSTYRYIKSSLKLLLALNNSEIADSEIDDIVNQMTNSSDGDSENVSETINNTLSNNSEFNNKIIQDINTTVNNSEKTSASKDDIKKFNSSLKESDKQLLNYIKNNTTMLLSKGLGGSKVLIIFACKPEIVSITLKSK